MRALLLSLYAKCLRAVSGHGLNRFYLFRALHRRALGFLRTDSVQVRGHTIFIDGADSLNLLVNPEFEPGETSLITREVREGDVVVDIGANIGYFTLLFARLVGPTGKVYAFEPVPANFALLQKNLRANGYTNVVVEQKAVYESNGHLRLFLSKEENADHRPFDTHDGRDSIEVESVRLDDYMSGREETVDFIKMDIQGGEGAALKGMTATLDANPDIGLFSEFAPDYLSGCGTVPADYLESLQAHGLRLAEIDGVTGHATPATAQQLLGSYPLGSWRFTNLFCRRSHAS